MARTKRTTRTARKPARTLDRVKAAALAQARVIARRGVALQAQGRRLAIAKAAQAREAIRTCAMLREAKGAAVSAYLAKS